MEPGDFVILILPGYGLPIWEHIPMVGLTDGVTAKLIPAMAPAMAMLPTQPILIMAMVLAEDLEEAEDLEGAEDSAEEDGGKPRREHESSPGVAAGLLTQDA